MRKRQQQAALRRLEEARAALRAVEERAERRRSEREKARAALDAARLRPTPDPLMATRSGREEADWDRYLARLGDDHRRACAAFDAFSAGPLQQARAAEEDARRIYTEARRACEALERHEQNFRTEERRAEERRDDEAAEEGARTAHHHRQQ